MEVPVNINNRTEMVDEEIVELVKQINRFEGIHTIESCFGHGLYPIRIFLYPDSIEYLPIFLYYTDSCHVGVRGWEVVIYTDCSADHVTWLLQSTSMGEKAKEEANQIAEYMRKYYDE